MSHGPLYTGGNWKWMPWEFKYSQTKVLKNGLKSMDFDVWRDPSRWVVDPVFMFFNAADRGAIRKNSMKFVEKHT